MAVRGDCKRKVAFGKVQDAEYYMYDCETHGPPMFSVGHGVSYILRMNTLDRLLYVLTLTLRGGDFFIYSIEIDSMKAINWLKERMEIEMKKTNYDYVLCAQWILINYCKYK